MSNPDDQSSPLSSPFYNGNITFGGANMAGLYKRSRILNNSNEVFYESLIKLLYRQ